MQEFFNTKIVSENKTFSKQSGEIISNRYLVEKPIGKGGSGEVYLVSDQLANGLKKALKLIRQDDSDLDFTKSFSKEFQFLRLLNHPGIVHGYEFGRSDSAGIFFTMEFVEWPTLSEIAMKLTRDISLTLLYHIAEELSFIQYHQIKHFALKPNNIFVNVDELFSSTKPELPLVKICDFGLSGRDRKDEQVVDNDAFTYLAPETFSNGRVDSRANIFSLGMIAYTLLTKKNPYSANSRDSLAYQKQNWIAVNYDWKEADINPALSAVFSRCLNPNPAFRPSDANEILAELSRITGLIRNGTPQFLSTPFVGRSKELNYLHSIMHDVENNEQWAFLYSGDAEIGKSRLIDEFALLQQMKGVKVVRLEGNDLTSLYDSFNPDKQNSPNQLVFTDLRELWSKIFHQFIEDVSLKPLVICWHKFDQAGIDSIQTFKDILLNYPKLPLLWLLENVKDHEELSSLAHADHLVRRPLTYLTHEEIEELIGQILGKPHGYKRLGRQLQSFVGGKPGWLIHSLMQLIDKKHITYNEGRWFIPDREIGLTNQDTDQFVNINISNLSSSARLVLEWLAVLNQRCEVEIVRSQLEIDPNTWSKIIYETSDIGLLKINMEVIEFRLPALQQFVYKSMLPEKRKEMHLWIGRWLEENISSRKAIAIRQTIAKHYLIADETTLFLGAVEEMLDLIQDASRPQIDVEILEAALEIKKFPLHQAHIYRCKELLGNAYLLSNRFKEGAKIFEQLISEPSSRRFAQFGLLHLNLGKCQAKTRDYEQALFHLSKAYSLSEVGDPDSAGQALSLLALINYYQGKLLRSYSQILRYRHLIERIPEGGRQSNHWLGCAKLFIFHHKIEEAYKCYMRITDNSKTPWDNSTVERAYQHRIGLLIKTGDWEEAIKLSDLLRRPRNLIDSFDQDWHHSYLKAMALFSGGKIDRGMQLFEKIRLSIKAHAKPLVQLRIMLDLIRVDYNRGFYWQGMRRIREAMGISNRLGLSYFTTVVYVWALKFRSMMEMKSDKLANQTKKLIKEEKHPVSTYVASFMLAEYYLEQNNYTEAEKLLDKSIANADRIDFEIPKSLLEIIKTRINYAQIPFPTELIDFRSLELSFDEIKQNVEKGRYYREMMLLAILADEKDLARDYFKKAKSNFKKIDSRYMQANCTLDFAGACKEWDFAEEASEFYSQALRIYNELNLPCQIASDYLKQDVQKGCETMGNGNNPELQEIAEVLEMLNTTENPDDLMIRILQIAVERVDARCGLILFKKLKTAGLARRTSVVVGNVEETTISYQLAERVLKTKKPIFTDNALCDESLNSIKSVKIGKIHAVACLPIFCKDILEGVLYLDNADTSREFSSSDKSYLPILTNLIGVVLNYKRTNVTSEDTVSVEPNRSDAVGGYKEFKGQSEPVQKVFTVLKLLREQESPVLILGESGTGKELIANIIHNESIRSNKPFIKVNCAEGPDALTESQYFGHVKGAFTGAVADKIGFFEEADGGTIFLDEVDKMSLSMQGKILRFLENGEYYRVGDQKVRRTNVRLITAANTDMQSQIEAGNFRTDLFYRINVVQIRVPALRDRLEDIPILMNHFVDIYSKQYSKRINGITKEVYSLLQSCNWIGNVRELKNIIENVFLRVKEGDIIGIEHFREFLSENVSADQQNQISLSKARDACEYNLIKKTIESCDGIRTEAARRLNISRSCLSSKIKKLNIKL